jgi:predicted chitinase|tara:strand:+ start:124 stop:834 length:711 start_codon:yes stop_codon:yes gene_type:complete
MDDLERKTRAIQEWAGAHADGIWGQRTANAIIVKANIDVAGRSLGDRGAFFSAVRKITGALNQRQVDSINLLLESAGSWPTSWVAYALATAWHESRLLPIRERGGWAYLAKYDTGRLARILGNTPAADGDGQRYAGRGFVQLTGQTNYESAGVALGIDLIADPDLALNPLHAARILIWGMEGGKFTGKKLSDYLPAIATRVHFRDARRIINGTDRADKIAGYAMAFQDALREGEWA